MNSAIPRFPIAKMFYFPKTTALGIIHKILTCFSIEKDFKADVENDNVFFLWPLIMETTAIKTVSDKLFVTAWTRGE